MIFLVNNGEYTIWIPIYTLNDESYDNLFYRGLLIIELVLSIIAFIIILTTGYIIITTKAFHTNMSSLFAFFVMSWISSAIGRSMLTPYLIGAWKVGNISSDYRSFWTDDNGEMTHIDSITMAIFFGNRQYNREIQKRFKKENGENGRNYTLPVRFQAKENLRVFNLTARVFVFGFLLIFLAISFLTVLTFKWIPSLDTFLTYCFENIVHLNPLVMCPVLIFSVGPWSKALFNSRLPMIHKITKITFIDLQPELPNQTQQQETETYFSQLNSVWEQKRNT